MNSRNRFSYRLHVVVLLAIFNVTLSTTWAVTSCQDSCDATLLNTSKGFGALQNDSGDSNTAIGALSLFENGSGANENTATGYSALSQNIGTDNDACGFNAMADATAGNHNLALGNSAMETVAIDQNGSAYGNTGVGNAALNNIYDSSDNVAVGSFAAESASYYNGTTAVGAYALSAGSVFGLYVAIGYNALGGGSEISEAFTASGANASGFEGVACGAFANANLGVSFGASALMNAYSDYTDGIGYRVGINHQGGSGNIYVGATNSPLSYEFNTIRIGDAGVQTAAFLAGVRGVAVSGTPLQISSSGELGVKVSSARFKEAIQPMADRSEAIFALRPVTFRYRKALDPQGQPEFGLLAEEVAKVSPDLVVRDGQGRPFSVRYDEVNAMLLNEFLKQHRRLEEQAALDEQESATIAKLQRQTKDLASHLQKVSAEVQAAGAPRLVSTTE